MCQKYDRLEDALICMSDLEKIVLRVLLGYIFVNDSLDVKNGTTWQKNVLKM